jgi:hypothetical protein
MGNDGAYEGTCFNNAEIDIHMYGVSDPYPQLRRQALVIFKAIEARL